MFPVKLDILGLSFGWERVTELLNLFSEDETVYSWFKKKIEIRSNPNPEKSWNTNLELYQENCQCAIIKASFQARRKHFYTYF
jgi:hypothetical protein